MNKLILYVGWLPFVVLSVLGMTGCDRSQSQPAGQAPPPPEVLVSVPVSHTVTDYEDFPGRTEAISSIDVRARVTGYLDKVNFKEGADVQQGDVLFQIDPRPYEAELQRGEANLVQAQAHLTRLDADYQRAKSLLGKNGISREDYDKITGDRAEAAAAIGVAKASRDLANLNVAFTKVKTPISGRISHRFIDPGNLVKADDTILTSVVSLDPIYAYFDLDERTTLRVQRLIRDKKIKWSTDSGLPLLLGLADEEGFSQRGSINFADNRVDPDTGTWRLRGLFANPYQILSPGLFVRIRLPIGDAYQATLISEQALGTDQGQRFVYVVDEAGKVAYRRVKVGRLHEGLRVVTEGLSPKDQVVVRGLQRVRPGIQVAPKVVEMPVVSAAAAPVSDAKSANGGQATAKRK